MRIENPTASYPHFITLELMMFGVNANEFKQQNNYFVWAVSNTIRWSHKVLKRSWTIWIFSRGQRRSLIYCVADILIFYYCISKPGCKNVCPLQTMLFQLEAQQLIWSLHRYLFLFHAAETAQLLKKTCRSPYIQFALSNTSMLRLSSKHVRFCLREYITSLIIPKGRFIKTF